MNFCLETVSLFDPLVQKWSKLCKNGVTEFCYSYSTCKSFVCPRVRVSVAYLCVGGAPAGGG